MRGLLYYCCLTTLLALSACGRSASLEASPGAAMPSPAELAVRGASSTGVHQYGEEAVQRSADNTFVMPDGTLGLMPTESANLAWAIYAFDLNKSFGPRYTAVDFAEGFNTWDTWVGTPDFENARWQIFGPYNNWNEEPAIPESHQHGFWQESGIYYVAVMVTYPNSAGVRTVDLSSWASDPVAALTATPASGQPGEPIVLDASASNDEDGEIVLYEWDFNGDGVYDISTGKPPRFDSTLPDPPAEYEVRVRVTDNKGLTDYAKATVSSLQ